MRKVRYDFYCTISERLEKAFGEKDVAEYFKDVNQSYRLGTKLSLIHI